jgi:glycosyltransferase involved in cell wall biosynthesis
MKVTIITAVLNCVDYIEECMTSVQKQDYGNIEHIIIDGGSVDGTLEVIKRHKNCSTFVLSECDGGIYEALNKGLVLGTGALFGILNADDRLASPDVLSAVADRIKIGDCDAVYGHLDFVSRDRKSILVRKWISKPYSRSGLENGWMPPHPAFYVKRTALVGGISYSLNYGSCGDYDFMLRLLYKNRIKAVCIDKLMIYMRTGGISNGSLRNILMSGIYDYRSLVENQIPGPLRAVILKKIRKVAQFRL